ncbi:uncharacterized protein K02A2.6-like [Saccostrea echinata]|uniref:uncharacterized protein K02A2.6-like n=1 Tax=Saccostrea echinata TaxID=191078 RepID=UPI002A7F06DB|nr:uncharacterized protein K02A2.6-like [Saccostrea echinata]
MGVQDLNGHTLSVHGIGRFYIYLEDVPHAVDLLVVDMDLTAILGQDFLLQYCHHINYKTKTLQTEKTTVQCWIANDQTATNVEVKKTVSIPANCGIWVPVALTRNGDLTDIGFLEQLNTFSDDIQVLDGLIDTQSDQIHVNIVNFGEEPVKLQARTTIGKCRNAYLLDQGTIPQRVLVLKDTKENTTLEKDLPEHLLDMFERSSINLDQEQKDAFFKLLLQHKDVFSKTPDDLGCTGIIKHKIDTENEKPVRQALRRQPIAKRDIERREVQNMLEKGVIEPSTSAWASNLVLVAKQNGATRACVDYRQLNAKTVKDAYPLPRIDECLDSLSGAKWFSTMDLNSGFWQIEMSERDKEKTAFVTTLGLFQFRVMPFGLVNAPSTFERLMENVLKGLQWTECLVYMDDIISYSSTYEEGLQRLANIFTRLQEANLKLKPSKCIFFQKQVKFLGHIVSSQGIQTDTEKISAVKNWPIPKNERQIRSFLGLCSYYRRFVKNFAEIAKPLLDLYNNTVSWVRSLKNPTGQTVRWLQEIETYDLTVTHRPGRSHQNADALSRNPCKPCLRQQQNKDDSDNSDDEKSNGSEGLESMPTIRVTTRSKEITQCQFRNQVILEGWGVDEIQQMQLEDQSMGMLLLALTDGSVRPKWDVISHNSEAFKTLWRQWDRLKVINGLLYREFQDVDTNKVILQLVVPKQKRSEVIHYFHDVPTGAHLGAEKTTSRIKNSFYWPSMSKEIARYCKKCDLCAARKSSQRQNRAPLGQYMVGEPMERIALDILGPLPESTKGNRYILVMIDCFTKWTEAIAIPDQEAETVITTFVNEIVCRFGTPLQVHSDQGRNFESKAFKEMCELLHIDKTRTSSMRPQANGSVERFNRTLATMLTMYCEHNQKIWDKYLPQVMMAYRASIHSSINTTPNLMMLGRNVNLPLEAVVGKPPSQTDDGIEPNEYIDELQRTLIDVHALAREHLKKSTEYNKRHYDQKAKKQLLERGQPVWLYDDTRKVGVCPKLTSKWKGPYLITKRIDDLNYLVQRTLRKPAKVYHVDRLMPYKGKTLPNWFKKILNKA